MELKEAGLDVGERRVGRLMKINGIRPVRTRKHKVTTDSHHRLGVAANWLDGDFVAAAPNQKWAGDITYVWTSEGWLYLAVILDLHSRRVVGWAASDRMKKDLAIRALDMAVRGYESHVNPDGFGPNYLVRQAGYPLSSTYSSSLTANSIEVMYFGTAGAVLFLTFDVAIKLLQLPMAIEGTTVLGYPASSVFTIGLIQLACLVLYLCLLYTSDAADE